MGIKGGKGWKGDERGVVTLGTTVVLFFAALVIAVSIQSVGLSELLMGFQESQSERAFEVADSCMNEAFLRLTRSGSYTGATLSVGTGSCTITVSGSGTTRTLVTAGTLGNATRRVRTQITITTAVGANIVTVDDWEELTN